MLSDNSKANRDVESAVRLGVDRALLEAKVAEFKGRAETANNHIK